MPRKGPAVHRDTGPDPVYQNVLVTQLINKILLDGKKTLAESTVYKALEMVSERTANDPVIALKKAVENVRPLLEVRSRRVGGANYQVPVPVRDKRQLTLSIRWILAACRGKKGRPIDRKLADEFMAAYRREGTAITTRENVHRMADANKAFAHFAW